MVKKPTNLNFITQLIIIILLIITGVVITKMVKAQDKMIYVITAMNIKVNKLSDNDSIMNYQLQHYPASYPIKIGDITKISSLYTERIDPISGEKRFHYGIDYSAKFNTPVYATADGLVEEIDKSYVGYGNMVKLNHLNKYESLYAHLSKISVLKGQYIKRGDILGFVGSTGKSTGNHLHYEIFYGYKPMNPELFFKINV